MKITKYLKSLTLMLIVALMLPSFSGNIFAQDNKGTEKTTQQTSTKKTKKHHKKHKKHHKKSKKNTSTNNSNTQKK